MINFLYKTSLYSYAILLLSGCGSSRESQDLDEQIAWAGKQCYAYEQGGNMVTLNATFTNGVVYGNLDYQWAEKDQNRGMIEGKMNGDTLIANYTFQSEGTQSVRQVAFIFDEKTAREGYGESSMNGNMMVFNNPSHLTFSDDMVLQKVDCPE